jgi:thymidylate synthase
MKTFVSYQDLRNFIIETSFDKELFFSFLDSDVNCEMADLNIENKKTNFGFRLAYFLWIMKGENKLESLKRYSNHIYKMSDDGLNLRGATGPRLRYWVGADQLQEATEKNLNIDDPKDMVKPKGVDQLQRIYDDLKAGLPSSSAVIFNPAIDFDDSNYIPDAISFTVFVVKKRLNMFISFNSIDVNGHFVNDLFFFRMLHRLYINLLGLEKGEIRFFSSHFSYEETSEDDILTFSNVQKDCFDEKDYDEFFENIYKLCDMEKHARSIISKESINNLDINMIGLCDKLIEKFINTISSNFWRNYGLSLLAVLLHIEARNSYNDYLENVILNALDGAWLVRFKHWQRALEKKDENKL